MRGSQGVNVGSLGVVAVGWNGYLSYLNQSAQRETTPSTIGRPVQIPVPNVEPVAVAAVSRPAMVIGGTATMAA
jgi:hypothetical protein